MRTGVVLDIMASRSVRMTEWNSRRSVRIEVSGWFGLNEEERMRAILLMGTILAIVSTPALAQKWEILEEEAVTLSYNNAQEESDFGISCDAERSEIVVPLAPGTKKSDAPVLLALYMASGVEKLKMEVSACEGGECTDRPDGEVFVYILSQDGKQLALKAASARRIEIDAPGVKFAQDLAGDKPKRFAEMCRKAK